MLSADVPPSLDGISNEELNHWLAWFDIEACTQKGEEYNGGPLLFTGIQCYIRERRVATNGEPIDIYKHPKLAHFRSVFNKELHVRTVKKQAKVL